MNKKLQIQAHKSYADSSEAGTSVATSVQAVGMAFAVLEALAQTREALGPSELARRLGQTKARVHRHLITLKALGFVDQEADTSQYRLGWKSYRFSNWCNENFGLRELARRHVIDLYRRSGQTALLATPAGSQITIVHTIESPDNITITVRPGSVIPMENSALGRAILAFQTDPGLRTPAVAQALEQVQRQWWAVAINERVPGVAALAAPIFDDRNRVVASVGLIASHAAITVPPASGLVRQVQEAAMQISRELHSTAWQEFSPAS